MQAVILAAGKGRRLRPLTLKSSKAMLKVGGKPMVERVMDTLLANNLEEFILVVQSSDQEIRSHFSAHPNYAKRISFVTQPEPLGSGDALRFASPLIRGDFLLSACDSLVDASHVRDLLLAWRLTPPPQAVLSLLAAEGEQTSHSGVVALDGDIVKYIIEKPSPQAAPSNIISLPLYIFHKDFLAYLPNLPLSPRGEYEVQPAIQQLIDEKGEVRGVMAEWRLNLTTSGDLAALQKHFANEGFNNQELTGNP